MSRVSILESTLTDIADAIREQLDTEDTYKPSEMADAIESISGGGITPTGTIEITQNGVVDVTNYASADVDIPTGSAPVINSLSVTENGTYTAPTGIDGYSPVTVNVSGGGGSDLDPLLSGTDAVAIESNVTTLRDYALMNVTLSNLSLPNLQTAGTQAFNNTVCNPQRAVRLDNLATVNNSTFKGFAGVTTLVLPKITSINKTTLFSDMNQLDAVDLGTSVIGAFPQWCFSGAKLSTLIIRRTSGVCSIPNINVFNRTNFASGGTGGTLYVPSSLVSSYQSANNWSTILGYSNNTIQSIEGSTYETHYADGTEIPTT